MERGWLAVFTFTLLDCAEQDCKNIVEAMLSLTELQEDCACPAVSTAVGAADIQAKRAVNRFHQLLQVLRRDQTIPPISMVTEPNRLGSNRSNADGTFVVNIYNIVEWLKKKALDSIIREKFGGESARICKVWHVAHLVAVSYNVCSTCLRCC